MSKQTLDFSLFEYLREKLGDTLPTIRSTKATLVHISHTLEDIILTHEIPALIFTGFQESTYWRQETERYRRLTQVAKQVCIFAGRPLPEASQSNALQIELYGDDPLRQEWFLVILSDSFSALLCGQDSMREVLSESQREFDTILTFDPTIIEPVLNLLEGVVQRYRPQRLQTLQDARQAFVLAPPNASLLANFSLEMILYQEALNLALERERNFNQRLLEAAPVFFVALDDEGRILIMNRLLLNRLGVRLSEVTGTNFLQQYVPSSERPGLYAEWRIAEQDAVFYEGRMQGRDGKTFLVDWRWQRLENVSGGHNLIGFGLDITQQKEAQQRDFELTLERERVQMLERFISDVSHDFRTPLANVQSSLYLLSVSEDAEKRKYYEQKLFRLAQHLQELVEDLMDIARLNNQTDVMTFHPLNLNQLVKVLVRDVEGLVEQKNLVLKFKPEHEPATIMADAVHIERAVSNVLSNALTYTPDGGRITLRTFQRQDEVVIEFADTGIGISAKDLPHIFERFFRADKSRSTAKGGSGLGLSIARRIVEAHRGRIEVASELGQGTTFWMTFPTLEYWKKLQTPNSY